MAKLKQKEWMTLKQAAQYLCEVADGPAISELDLIQYAIEGNLILSLHCFSFAFPAMPGRLVAPSEAAVTLSRISEVVQFCDIKTRQEWNTGTTHNVRNAELPNHVQEAARTILLGRELTGEMQKALNEINDLFPDKPKGEWSFDFVGNKFKWLDSEVVFEISGPEIIVSETWDIATFGYGKLMLEMTWQRAQEYSEENITSLEAFPDETLYLVHEDGTHCAAVHDAARAISDDCTLCVRPKNLRALFEDEPTDAVEPFARHKQKSELQREAILATLRDQLNLDPLNLPLRKAGRNPGPKAQCRDILISNNQLFTEESFKTAWKNLRALGEIKGGD